MLYDDIHSPRLLIEADLVPVQGSRFQPTGFPDLGAAIYRGPSGTEMVLVESVQSMANRLEKTVWDDQSHELVPPLKGLPYVKVFDGHGQYVTSSIEEAHRLNSPYVMDAETETGDTFLDVLKKQFDVDALGLPSGSKLASGLVRHDMNALLHGVFFARTDLFGGRLRLSRMLSAFVEAEGASVVMSGGVKLDHIDPSGDAKSGRGHVPFARQEFSAEKITAYFNLDLAELRGFSLSPAVNDLIISLGLYKIQALLQHGMRFRTACDFQVVATRVTQPEEFEMPSLTTLEEVLEELIGQAANEGSFANPAVTRLVYKKPLKEKK